MARCKDCIHDKVCDEWAVTSGIPFVNSETCEHFTPTADVVAKSEVETLKSAYEGSQKTIKGLTEMIREKNKELAKLETHLDIHHGERSLNKLIAEERAEAIKEFAERLKERSCWFCENQIAYEHFDEELDQIVKELTEEKI